VAGLWFNRLRSTLTGIGVLVGVASVVLIMALSDALIATIDDEDVTSCQIALMSSAEADADVLDAMSSPDIVARLQGVAQRTDVASFAPEAQRHIVEVSLPTGVSIGSMVVNFTDSVPVIAGEPFTRATGDVVIMRPNPDFSNVTIGDQIVINGQFFQVIGTTDSHGMTPDTKLFLPERMSSLVDVDQLSTTGTHLLIGQQGFPFSEVRQSVIDQLNDGIDPDMKFFDMSAEMASGLRDALGTIQMVLGAIASVSLAVAALNIVNTMYIASLERVDEIAVLKSMGMTRVQVMALFLLESVLLVTIFALLGALIGNLCAALILTYADIPMAFSWMALATLVPVIVLVGAGGGFYPAHRAAKIDPVRLLR